MKGHVLFLGSGWLALVPCLLLTAGGISAQGDADYRSSIQKLADAVKEGDSARAKQLSEEIAGSGELLPVMETLAKRDPKGKKLVFGVGKKPGAITPDGIEAKIQSLSRKAQPQKLIDKEADDLAEMAYRVEAIALVAKAKAPEKDTGMKKKKDWLEWSDAMQKSAADLAQAAKNKNPTAVKNTAAKLNSSCNNCHGVFRD